MEYLEKLKTTLCDELEEYARKPEMSAGDLEAIHKLTDTIKNIDKIAMLEDDGGYSRDGNWEAEGRGSGSYERGASYRGRKRDSMGRYSRDGRYSSTGRMYSRADVRDGMMAQLEEMMDHASEQERTILRQAMDKLEKV